MEFFTFHKVNGQRPFFWEEEYILTLWKMTILKYFAVQCSPVTERALLCLKIPKPRLFVILKRITLR